MRKLLYIKISCLIYYLTLRKKIKPLWPVEMYNTIRLSIEFLMYVATG